MYSALRKQLFTLLLPTLILALFAGCAQQRSFDETAAKDGLEVRKTGLDSVAAAYAFDMSGAKVYLEPLIIEYSKQYPRDRPLTAKDYELDQKDVNRLQELMAATFNQKFLTPRNSSLIAEQQQADYTLQLKLEKFSLAAPLTPSPWLWRVYTDQSAYGVLSGELRDRNGNLVMRFRDRRDIGENFGSFGFNGDFERFTSVTFWADMRTDLRRAFTSLDKALR
ncbi:MAG: hypothetical protein K0U59_02095 [Gammaproteobacteria bacterium]|nr:hypothetical protein [Gammaproteobacteria bacterium]